MMKSPLFFLLNFASLLSGTKAQLFRDTFNMRAKINIDAPLATVVEFVCDPKNVRLWRRDVVDFLPDGEEGVGHTYTEEFQLFKFVSPIFIPLQLTAAHPSFGCTLDVIYEDGGPEASISKLIEETSTGVRITYDWNADTSFARLIVGFPVPASVASFAIRMVQTLNLRTLRRLLEDM
mgnify:CR=1 FL=1